MGKKPLQKDFQLVADKNIQPIIFYVVIQITRVLLILIILFISFVIRELKRKQALLRSNLSAINFLRYTVTFFFWRGGLYGFPFHVTDIAIWLRKPLLIVSLLSIY